MTFAVRQRLGRAVLLLAFLAGGAWLLSLDFGRKLSSDVLDLVPADGQAPELRLVRSLAGEAEARTMLLAVERADGGPVPPEAAVRLAAALAAEPAFDAAVPLHDPAARDALGAEVFAQRFALLFPRWLARRANEYRAAGAPAAFDDWLADEAAGALDRFLARPEALAFAEVVPADPLLLIPTTVAGLQDDLAPAGGAVEAGLVWARLAAPPLTEAGQAPAFAAIARAEAALRATWPDVSVAYTGVNRFAAASRARIEREVKTLNAFSVLAVLAVALAFVRRVHRGLHLLPVILLSILGAWVGTTLLFERLHILVLVVGSLLTGVAVDYGFYLFMQPAATPGETYGAKVRRLAKPLLASCLTTVAGFALLLFSDLPFIRQLGAYVGIGLLCALGAALVYFGTVRDPYLETRTFRGGRALPAGVRRALRRALAVAWLAALPGLFLIGWRDDIRDLEIPSPELKAEDARLRAHFGGENDRAVYLTYGDTLAAARERLAAFESWLASQSNGVVRVAGLGAIVPTAAERTAAAEFLRTSPDFAGKLAAALERTGFAADEFAPFVETWPRDGAIFGDDGWSRALAAVESRLSGPLALLVHRGEPYSWFVTLAAGAPAVEPPPELGAVATGQLQSLNRVFANYRQSALRLSLVGLAIVGLGVFLTYGLRDGLRIFAIPCGVCLGVFGVLGWFGVPLNLFHLLGAFLGVCMTHNYAIFSATSAYRREPPPVSVRVSALTTAASFGVLATSGIPVVAALGLTVASMVLAALAAVELEHLAGLGDEA